MANPNWKKGVSGNPKGRPKDAEADLLRKALKDAAKKRGKKGYLEHLAERFYENDKLAVAMAKKILPDLSSIDGKIDSELTILPPLIKKANDRKNS